MLSSLRPYRFLVTLLAISSLVGCASSLERERVSIEWTELKTPTRASLRGVCVLNQGIVWASGSDGTVMRSMDRGETWTVLTGLDSSADYRDIEARDAYTAWAMAITKPAQLLHTGDGGENWSVVHSGDPEESFFDSVALFEDAGGILFGDPQKNAFEILHSDDGITWSSAQPSVPILTDGEAGFAASGTCVVTHGDRHAWIGTGGAAVRVLRSDDRGRTWQGVEAPFPQGGSVTGIYSVHFMDEKRGVIVGGAYTKPELAENNAAYTTDGGESWQLPGTGLSGYRSSVTTVFGRGTRHPVLLAVGKGGADYSIDGGRNWRPLSVEEGYYAIDASSDGTVIAVGSEGRAAAVRVVVER